MEIRTLTRNHKFYKLHLAAQSLPAPIRTVDARTRQTPTFVVGKVDFVQICGQVMFPHIKRLTQVRVVGICPKTTD